MADPTLITTVSHPSISRRSMLASGALAAPAVIVPRLAAAGGADPDAGLRRRIVAAHARLDAYRRADAARLSLHEAVRRHPVYLEGMPRDEAGWARWDAMLDAAGTPAADDRCERLYDRYEAALAAAFAGPARTLPGVLGRLRLAVTAAKQEQEAGYDTVDFAHLDATLGDLACLAAI